MTGLEFAIASRNTRPNPSARLGSAKHIAVGIADEEFLLREAEKENGCDPRRQRSRARCSSLGRSPPSPTSIRVASGTVLQNAWQRGKSAWSAPLYRSAGSQRPTVRMMRAPCGNAAGRGGEMGARSLASNSGSSPQASRRTFFRANSLVGNQMLGGVSRLGRNDHIRAAKRRAARPSERLPYFQAMSEYDRSEFFWNAGASPKRREARWGMHRDD